MDHSSLWYRRLHTTPPEITASTMSDPVGSWTPDGRREIDVAKDQGHVSVLHACVGEDQTMRSVGAASIELPRHVHELLDPLPLVGLPDEEAALGVNGEVVRSVELPGPPARGAERVDDLE